MTLKLKPEAVWCLPGSLGTGVLREREKKVGTVMALKARWNLVLRLLVDNGLREKSDR